MRSECEFRSSRTMEEEKKIAVKEGKKERIGGNLFQEIPRRFLPRLPSFPSFIHGRLRLAIFSILATIGFVPLYQVSHPLMGRVLR